MQYRFLFILLIVSMLLQSCSSKSRIKAPINERGTAKKTYAQSKLEEFHCDFKLVPSKIDKFAKIVSEINYLINNEKLESFIQKCDTNLVVNFGGGLMGIKDLFNEWDLESKKGKKNMFKELRYLTAMGYFQLNDSTIRFPYFADDHLYASVDIADYDIGILIWDSNYLYNSGLNKKILKIVGHCVCKVHDEIPRKSEFVFITLSNGISGYINEKRLYQFSDRVLTVEKRKQGWIFTEFCNGL